jgi:ribose transport system substrate-binding protein
MFLCRLFICCAICIYTPACGSRKQLRIAVIPQTDGIPLWDSLHAGAEAAADRSGSFIYWNAPTREDDVEAQIGLVEHVIDSGYRGLVLAPDQALALLSPVRQALSRGIPTVIVGSPIPIPPGGNLFYILNADEKGGELAARRVTNLVHQHGAVAILGINPDITGIMIRARAFEQFLVNNCPDVRIVDKRIGSFNVSREQQVAEDTLKAHPDLKIIVALTGSATDAAIYAINKLSRPAHIKVIGFDSLFWPTFDQRTVLDSVIQEDTRAMGQQAVELINAKLAGQSVPSLSYLGPKLITRDNVSAADVRQMFSQDWQFGHVRWSPIQ